MKNKKDRYIIHFFSVLMLALISYSVNAQLISITAKPDTNTIIIGEQTTYTIRVVKDQNVQVVFPDLETDTLANGIEILDFAGSDSSILEDGQELITRSYLITSFDSGLFYIPPMHFPFYGENISDTIQTSASYLEVRSIPVNLQEDIKDIKGPLRAPVTFREILPWLLGVIVAAGIMVFLMYYFKQQKADKPIIQVKKPREPAHVRALRDLEKLKAEKLWQQGKIKEYYSRLTDIVRLYIEERYNIPAMEETSSELLYEFEKRGWKKEIAYELLRQLLVIADLAKFAKEKPLPDENEGYFNNAVKLIEHTKEEPIILIKDEEKIISEHNNENESALTSEEKEKKK
ncbi:MAG: hypothetical protein ACOCXS_00315 [Bacteroidota bacterium]